MCSSSVLYFRRLNPPGAEAAFRGEGIVLSRRRHVVDGLAVSRSQLESVQFVGEFRPGRSVYVVDDPMVVGRNIPARYLPW